MALINYPENHFFKIILITGSLDLFECFVEEAIEPYLKKSNKEEAKIFFDRAYPDRMKDVFGEIVEKYSANKETAESPSYYYFTPDIDMDDRMDEPYMDRIRLKKMPYIGVNTRSLYLNRNYDWSKVKIAPNAKIKELIIETTDIPQNMLEVNIQLEWVKFKYLKINTLSNFENISANVIKIDGSKDVLDVIIKKKFLDLKQKIDCRIYSISIGKMGIYFVDGNSYNYDTNAINGVSLLNGKLFSQTQLISGSSGGMVGAAYFRELALLKIKNKIPSLYDKNYCTNIK